MRRLLKEIALLIPGSLAAGWFIATVQHFVVFGFLGGGFGWGPFELAFFEGGILGGAFGIPTGFITYYLALRRRVTLKIVSVIVIEGLVAGCVVAVAGARMIGDAFVPVSALITPLLTIAIAVATRDLEAA